MRRSFDVQGIIRGACAFQYIGRGLLVSLVVFFLLNHGRRSGESLVPLSWWVIIRAGIKPMAHVKLTAFEAAVVLEKEFALLIGKFGKPSRGVRARSVSFQ